MRQRGPGGTLVKVRRLCCRPLKASFKRQDTLRHFIPEKGSNQRRFGFYLILRVGLPTCAAACQVMFAAIIVVHALRAMEQLRLNGAAFLL